MSENNSLNIKVANTILYCHHWKKTVAFYQEVFNFPISFSSDWFVEFQLNPMAYLSIADEQRATIKSAGGLGLTVTFEVECADEVWVYLQDKNVPLEPLRDHPWGARVFYFYDPEGNIIELAQLANSGIN